MRLWLDTNPSFRDFCQGLPKGMPVALDTEFAWTKTYFPCFALLQIGVDRENAALADPLAITDWTPLAELLADETRPKICFSAGNDLPILARACGGTIPGNVFDVQIAAGFCGESSSQSLKAIIESHLGISLPKTETRSDWTLRPLTEKQREYAADDVVLLPELALEFRSKLSANGNMKWFSEEMEELYCRPDAYRLPPVADAWKRLKGLARIAEPAARRRGIALAVWREETGRRLNIARPRILSDEQLYWCAYQAPSDTTALFRMPECWPKRVRPFAEELLEIIANPPPEPPTNNATVAPAALNPLTDRFLKFIRKRAEEHQIDPILLGSRHDAEHLALCRLRNKPLDGRLTTGWRRELLGEIPVEK